MSSNIDARLTRAAGEGEGASRTGVAPPWPSAVLPGAPGMPQTIYSANATGGVTVDAHGHPIVAPGAGASQGYFLSQNPEPPHFRRQRTSHNGDGDSAGGSNADGTPPPRGEGEGEEEGDEIEDDTPKRAEGSQQPQQPGMVDPNEEHHKAWQALMQARMDVEARAALRNAQMMQTGP